MNKTEAIELLLDGSAKAEAHQMNEKETPEALQALEEVVKREIEKHPEKAEAFAKSMKAVREYWGRN